ncbi:hypothetical protein P154DRAFT_533624 [Amniculicola lignicola CBS 123094]|uniref:Uncharacterized protein n=1 Tax=Amniculicola lignicola CBS 123094 TaxID=1392246 RepID=A0A6A5WIK1_9PLEO|nr:hypothetical protein P154DRAFT_533624 [Amniculicola lignicola CBS 123094]
MATRSRPSRWDLAPPSNRRAASARNARAPIPPISSPSVLPKTPYSEADDKSERTLPYVSAQVRLLKYLSKHGTDKLGIPYLHKLTSSINPGPNNEPSPAEAIKFCYYMRSLGVDVYSRLSLDKTTIKLFLANGIGIDKAYWQQDLQTEEVKQRRAAPPRPTTTVGHQMNGTIEAAREAAHMAAAHGSRVATDDLESDLESEITMDSEYLEGMRWAATSMPDELWRVMDVG